MPLVRRVPKRGFNNQWALKVAVVNVGQINENIEAGEEVSLRALAAKNLARGRYDILKVLGDGELTKKVTIQAHRFSKSAVEKIEKAGAEMITLATKIPVEVKKKEKKEAKKKAAAAKA